MKVKYGLNLFNLFSFFLAIHQVAIHTADVADTMDAIEITGAESAKNYIPIQREGSEPSRLPHTYSVLHTTFNYSLGHYTTGV